MTTFHIKEDTMSGRAFVVYEITCDELGQSWVLNRRWNDLKRAMEDLQRSNGTRLNERREHIPRFEPHAFRFDPLESGFLQQRCVAAEALLQALVRELDVSVVRETGPVALRQLLERNGQPGDAPTPDLLGPAGRLLARAPAEALLTSAEASLGEGDTAGNGAKRTTRIARLEPLLDAAIEPDGVEVMSTLPQARRLHAHHITYPPAAKIETLA